MPNENGDLSQEERELIANWLNSKASPKGGVSCPVCGGRSFAIIPHVIHGMPYTRGALTVGGPAYPMVGVTCDNCAHILSFMAVPIGIKFNV